MGTTTPKKGLYKPSVSETGWGALIDANWDIVDGLPVSMVRRVVVDHTLTTTPTTLFAWPTTGIAVGDLFVGAYLYITTAFNGTTPKLTSYIDLAANVHDVTDATIVSPPQDLFAGASLVTYCDKLDSANNLGPCLITKAGSFLISLTNGSGGSPSSTVGAGEFWLFFATVS